MEPLELRASLGLAPEAESARLARRFISDFCNAAALGEDLCHTASLLTSELVTNAVRYGGSHALFQARMPGGVLRVAVQDANPELPALGASPDLTAEGGRGVLLVSTLADRWGVERTPGGGKAVWFELDVPPPNKA
jgi:anti-sigma regulatory factor (Ser/Thr protein kinase)